MTRPFLIAYEQISKLGCRFPAMLLQVPVSGFVDFQFGLWISVLSFADGRRCFCRFPGGPISGSCRFQIWVAGFLPGICRCQAMSLQIPKNSFGHWWESAGIAVVSFEGQGFELLACSFRQLSRIDRIAFDCSKHTCGGGNCLLVVCYDLFNHWAPRDFTKGFVLACYVHFNAYVGPAQLRVRFFL